MPKRPERRPARKRPRRPQRIPANGARRARSPQPPKAVELLMMQALRRVAARFASAARGVLTEARIKRFAKAEDDQRADALDDEEEDLDDEDLDEDELAEIMAELEEAIEAAYDAEELEAVQRKAAARAHEHSKQEFKRVGIGLPKREPELKHLMDGWRRDNVARIKGMQDSQREKIRDLLERGQDMRWETLADAIERQVDGVTASRAEAIARQSVLRLNGQITRERQTACGIEKYVWTTSGDERVREEHADLDGETFSWDEPPDETGHPGEDPNCRCTAFPILPELAEDEDEDVDEAAE